MPAFLVHGVPDTHHLWDGVRQHFSRTDVIAPDMPGFDRDASSVFGFSKENYLDWLIAEVEKEGEPVDIVGHDWGALLVERLVSVRPDLVRTWAAGAGAIDENYVWHPIAQMWQTPGVGENVMQTMTPEAIIPTFVNDGMPEAIAREITERIDDRMKAAILPLYRSAVNVGKEWGPALDGVSRPGLLIWGEKDQYMPTDFAKRMAERTGAKLVVLPGGHWWPAQFPRETAEALEAHWATAAG
jgi:pimeloyl-ACP methyl ester carboxylesterase